MGVATGWSIHRAWPTRARAQLEAARLLLSRTAMAVRKASSAGAVFAGSEFQQNFAADAVQESVAPALSRLLRERQRFVVRLKPLRPCSSASIRRVTLEERHPQSVPLSV